MKKILIFSAIVTLLLSGCGYKTEPIHVPKEQR
jgi:uncharacterized protein YceK